MRKMLLATFGTLAMLATLTPQIGAVRHDDPCGAIGDAADAWPGARVLSAAGLGAGCVTESIQAANGCGAAVDPGDWFFANVPPTAVLGQVRVTLTFLFTFCGGPAINGNIEVYFVPLGAVLPPNLYPSQDGNGPGIKVCQSNNAGQAQELITCTPPGGVGAADGRWYVHKIRAAGTGAHNLRVQLL